jgi:hypothetical protein
MRYLIFLLFLYPHLAAAAPTISTTANSGDTLTITGYAFGVKPTAQPLRYDDFENTVVGEDVDSATSYYVSRDVDTNRSTVSLEKARTGSLKSLKSILNSSMNNPKFWKNSVGFGGANSKIFISLWVRWEWPVWSGGTQYEPTQIKAWRVSATVEDSGNVVYPAINAFNWIQSDYSYTWTTYSNTYYGGSSDTHGFSNDWLIDGQWHNYILQVDQGTAGNADGAFYAWLSKEGNVYNLVSYSGTGKMIIDATGDYIDAIKIDNYLDANNQDLIDAGEILTSTLYWDDIYIDNSWARVEIGDASTYDNCTHREVQIPSAWTDTEITASVNSGSFPIGETVYLYVVDSNGVVNTSGYAITLDNSKTTIGAGTSWGIGTGTPVTISN